MNVRYAGAEFASGHNARKSSAALQCDLPTPLGKRLLLYRSPQPAQDASSAEDVRAGLSSERKRLAPKYFYDELGSGPLPSRDRDVI
jgi:hypothetical protein